MIRGTDHDRDITIPSTGGSPADPFEGIYHSVSNVTPGDITAGADMSVDNLEVVGAIADRGASVLDINVDDIESGILDAAPVTVLVCDWRNPAHGYFVIKHGYLGAISRDSDMKYTTEVRGMTQLLSQQILQTFSETCNVVRLGDARCKFDISVATVTGTITSQNNRRSYVVSIPSSVYSFAGGTITFTSGENTAFFREVKLDPNANGGVLTLWDEMPTDAAPGDTFTLVAGCDRRRTTCKNTFSNLANFRGYGPFIPGLLAMTAGPL